MHHIYSFCENDDQCKSAINPNQRCSIPKKGSNSIFTPLDSPVLSAAANEAVCRNKGLFSPYSWTDIVFTLIIFVGGAIAAGSGIGGGGIIVPILVTVGKFGLEDAIPLSSVCWIPL